MVLYNETIVCAHLDNNPRPDALAEHVIRPVQITACSGAGAMDKDLKQQLRDTDEQHLTLSAVHTAVQDRLSWISLVLK